MKRVAWLLFVVALTLGGRVAAQSRPDFSGTWTAPDGFLTIRQDAGTMTVTEGAETKTHNLDGSDSPVGPNGRRTAQARWVGSALVVTTTTVSPIGPIGTWQNLEVYSMTYGPELSVVQIATQSTRPMMSTTVKKYTKR